MSVARGMHAAPHGTRTPAARQFPPQLPTVEWLHRARAQPCRVSSVTELAVGAPTAQVRQRAAVRPAAGQLRAAGPSGFATGAVPEPNMVARVEQ